MSQKEKETPPQIMVLSLLDRRPSQTVLEGTENTAHPIYLDCPGRRRILNRSHKKVMNPETGEFEYKAIRYIRGAQSIFEEDQEKAGVKPNPLADVLWINDGIEIIVRRGADITRFDYLQSAMFNDMAENRDPDYPAIYTEIRQKEVAKTDLGLLELQNRATGMVLALREGGKDGTDYIYKVDEIDVLATLFNVTGVSTPEEKMVALHTTAINRPDWFLDTILDKTKSLRVDIMSAKAFACLDMGGAEAKLTQHGKSILKFKASEKKEDERLDEMVRYFLNPSGRNDYNQMMLDLDKAKQAQA